MGGAIAAFFDGLGRRGPGLLPPRAAGTIRFELISGEGVDQWLVSMDPRGVRVAHDRGEADCVLHVGRQLFERMVTGQAALISAIVRTDCVVEGNFPLLMAFRRFLPAAPGAVDPRRLVRQERRPP